MGAFQDQAEGPRVHPQDSDDAGDDHVLRGSLDGQVGSLIKALRFLDYCC